MVLSPKSAYPTLQRVCFGACCLGSLGRSGAQPCVSFTMPIRTPYVRAAAELSLDETEESPT